MAILPGDTILFTGDSIPDCMRVRDDPNHFGFGYVAFAAAPLEALLPTANLQISNGGTWGMEVSGLLESLIAICGS